MKYLLIKDILSYLEKIGFDFEYDGNENLTVLDFSSIDNLNSKEISWIKDINSFDFDKLLNVEDSLIVCNKTSYTLPRRLNYIKCSNPKGVFFSILKEFFEQRDEEPGIKSSAIVESGMIGYGVQIGHNSYIGKDVKVGNNVIIKNNVTIEGKVSIGDDTIIHTGAVIGKSGFGYYTSSDGRNQKVPHYGGVSIGKYVEVGANVCIDKGAIDNTVIEDYVKINNNCHIAHNVSIGENSLITAGVIISGSTKIEADVYIAPGSIIRNQLKIGKNSYVGMGSVVVKDVDANLLVIGVPAKVIKRIGDD